MKQTKTVNEPGAGGDDRRFHCDENEYEKGGQVYGTNVFIHRKLGVTSMDGGE